MSAFSVAAFTLAWLMSGWGFGKCVVVMCFSASRHTRLIALIFALLAVGVNVLAAVELSQILFPLENV